jgi:hypothetical protein
VLVAHFGVDHLSIREFEKSVPYLDGVIEFFSNSQVTSRVVEKLVQFLAILVVGLGNHQFILEMFTGVLAAKSYLAIIRDRERGIPIFLVGKIRADFILNIEVTEIIGFNRTSPVGVRVRATEATAVLAVAAAARALTSGAAVAAAPARPAPPGVPAGSAAEVGAAATTQAGLPASAVETVERRLPAGAADPASVVLCSSVPGATLRSRTDQSPRQTAQLPGRAVAVQRQGIRDSR